MWRAAFVGIVGLWGSGCDPAAGIPGSAPALPPPDPLPFLTPPEPDPCPGKTGEACLAMKIQPDAEDSAPGAEPPPMRAQALVEMACFKGHVAACVEAGDALTSLGSDANAPLPPPQCKTMDETDCSVPKDRARGLAFWLRGCDAEEWAGCAAAAPYFLRGSDLVARDVPHAAALYGRACGAGYAAACYEYGRRLQKGEFERELHRTDLLGDDIAPDPAAEDVARGRWLIEIACVLDHREACRSLAIDYSLGRNAPKDPARSVELLRDLCADSADDPACPELAKAYKEGNGTDKDLGAAVAIWEPRCAALDPSGHRGWGIGHDDRASACFELAEVHEHGLLGPPDLEGARALHRKACAAELKSSCEALKRLGGRTP